MTLFIDVDTQIDFVYPAGALYVPGAERIVATVGRLNRWAAAHGIPVLSTTDAHGEADLEFRQWPPHCVAGTAGQAKPAGTLLDRRVVVPNVTPIRSLEGAQQIVVEKQTTDVFLTETIQPLLAVLQAQRAVVYGVVTEVCVAAAALGLQKAGLEVIVVADAIKELDAANAQPFFGAFVAAGGKLATFNQIATSR